jgi:hypothetical protein
MTSAIVKRPGPSRFRPSPLFTIEAACPARSDSRPAQPSLHAAELALLLTRAHARRQADMSTQLRNAESAPIAASESAAARCMRNHFPVRVHKFRYPCRQKKFISGIIAHTKFDVSAS